MGPCRGLVVSPAGVARATVVAPLLVSRRQASSGILVYPTSLRLSSVQEELLFLRGKGQEGCVSFLRGLGLLGEKVGQVSEQGPIIVRVRGLAHLDGVGRGRVSQAPEAAAVNVSHLMGVSRGVGGRPSSDFCRPKRADRRVSRGDGLGGA